MSSFLDKTISLREIWRWTRRVFYLALPIYIGAIIIQDWNLKMGGVSLNHSPYVGQIPGECKEYAVRSSGRPELAIIDRLLLRGRFRRLSVDRLTNHFGLMGPCLGFAVLAGLHDTIPGDANFIDHYVDAQGDSIVTIRVEYHKAFVRSQEKQP